MINGITATLDCSMAEAEERVRAALAAQGFGVLTEIDVAATLKAKIGVERPAMKILGACNPVLANEVINRDDSLTLMLPCNVVLDDTGAGIRVRAIDPLGVLPGDEVVDIAARVIELTTAPGASVDAIRVSADGTRVFAAVTTPAGGSLAIIDTRSGAVQRTAALGGSIGDIAVAPRGRKVFVTGWDAELGGVIHVVDAAAARLIDTVALGGLPTQLVFGRGGDIAFVVDRDQIVVLCTATHEVIDSVVIGGQLSCLAASPDGAQLYAADYAGTITALRVEAGTGHALHELVSTGLRELAAAAS